MVTHVVRQYIVVGFRNELTYQQTWEGWVFFTTLPKPSCFTMTLLPRVVSWGFLFSAKLTFESWSNTPDLAYGTLLERTNNNLGRGMYLTAPSHGKCHVN